VEELMHVLRTLELKPKSAEYHRTKRGWHLAIRIREKLSPVETVGAQFALRSDRRRELLNLMRARFLDGVSAFWRKRSNLLYERKLADG
jgi:hypothetical protein